MNQINCWGIPSNGGGCSWRFVNFELIDETTDTLRFYCYLLANGYERGDPQNKYNVLRDIRMELTTVVAKRTRCKQLIVQLETWIETREPFVCDLCDSVSQFLEIRVDEGEGSKLAVDIPRLTIHYCASPINLEISYPVDETCIRQARNELNRILERYGT